MPDSKPALNNLPKYPHIPTFVLLLFCGYVVIWYLQIGYRQPKLGQIRIEYLWAIGLSFFALVYTRSESYRNPLTPYLILYFLVIVIQVPLSYNPEHSWKIFVDRIIKFAFMAWFIITFVKSPRGLVFFIATFMLVCMKMGQEGFVGQLTGNLVWQNQGVMRLHGSTPMYAHPNSFSGMALGTLPFIIAFFPLVSKPIKVLLALQAVLDFNIIIFTGSRTGYVAAILLAIFAIYKSKVSKIKLSIAVGIAVLIALQVIPSDYIRRFKSIYDHSQQVEGASSETRIEILKDAWAIFLDHPFGIGVGVFPLIRNDVFGRSQDTHNLYLEIATNLGLQGLIVFALFIYAMLTILNRIRGLVAQQTKDIIQMLPPEGFTDKKGNLLSDLRLIEASALSVYLFIIVRLGLGLFGMDLYEIYWWLASGLTIALYNIQGKIPNYFN